MKPVTEEFNMRNVREGRGLLHVLRNDARGGLELSTLEVASYLAEQGVAQQLLILREAGPDGVSAAFAALGIPVTYMPFQKRAALLFAFRFWGLLRRVRPDVVLVNGALGLHGPLCWLAWLAGVPRRFVYLVMGPTGGLLATASQWTLTQCARPIVTRTIAISETLKAQFVRRRWLPASAMVTCYRWRQIDAIGRRAEAARAARQSAGGTEVALFTVSRLDWMKNLDKLMQEIAPFLLRHPAAVWRIAGEGPMLARLEGLASQLGIAGQVKFLLHQDEVPELLGQADAFVFSTSAVEGLGNVMVEAMAAGVPVLAFDVGPCREILDDGRAGVLFAPGVGASLADQLEALLRDQEACAALVGRARRHVRQFSAAVQGPLLMTTLFPENDRDASEVSEAPEASQGS